MSFGMAHLNRLAQVAVRDWVEQTKDAHHETKGMLEACLLGRIQHDEVEN